MVIFQYTYLMSTELLLIIRDTGKENSIVYTDGFKNK